MIKDIDPSTLDIYKKLGKEFYSQYFNKKLLQTWINIHLNFYKHETFTSEDFKDWNGKVLIIRTDNDPLMQDEGEFKKIYPNVSIYTFRGTGHLTFFTSLNKSFL